MKTMMRLMTLCLLVATSVIALARSSRTPFPEPGPVRGSAETAWPLLLPGNGKLQITLCGSITPTAPGTPESVNYQEACYSWSGILGDLRAYTGAHKTMILWNTTARRWEDADGNPIDNVTEWTGPKPPKQEE